MSDTSVFNSPSDDNFLRQYRLDRNENAESGLHEDWHYYYRCDSKGVDRYGFECPEERQHYPYWKYSPFFDIGLLNSDGKCEEEAKRGKEVCVQQDGDFYHYKFNVENCGTNGRIITVFNHLHFIKQGEKSCRGHDRVFGFYLDDDLIYNGKMPTKKAIFECFQVDLYLNMSKGELEKFLAI